MRFPLKQIQYALSYSHSDEFIIEDFITQHGYSSDTDSFSIDGELKFVSFDCQRFDLEAKNPYTPAAYSWPSSMTAEHQEELKNEIQRLLKLLKITVPTMLKSSGMMQIKGWLVSILTSQGIRKFINARKWYICSKIAKMVP